MERDKNTLYHSCTRFLSLDPPPDPRQTLAELAAGLPEGAAADHYGGGALLEDFERQIADMLGKPAAVFGPSGKMLQNAALRVWADRSGTRAIALHPQCHIATDEADAYREVFGLEPVWLGRTDELPAPAALAAVAVPLGAVSLELPLRNIGCRLHSWEELQAFATLCRERSVPLHADAARLWESQPFYGRSHAELAGMFDSLYVSFYKGLGGLAGGALAGPADLVEEVRLWQQRCGGRLRRLFPYIASARQGLDRRLARMPLYHEKAKAIAAALAELPGVRIDPDPPQANAFRVTLQADGDLMDAAMQVAADSGFWLLDKPLPSPGEGLGRFEITVREGAMALSEAEIVAAFQALQDALLRQGRAA